MIWSIECAEFWLRFIPMFFLLRRGHESRNVLHHGLQCFLHERGNCWWALARDTWIFGRGRWGEWLLMLRWTRFQLLVLGMFSCSQPFFLGENMYFIHGKNNHHIGPFPQNGHFLIISKKAEKLLKVLCPTLWNACGWVVIRCHCHGNFPQCQPSQEIGPYEGVIHHHCPLMIPQ